MSQPVIFPVLGIIRAEVSEQVWSQMNTRQRVDWDKLQPVWQSVVNPKAVTIESLGVHSGPFL